MINDNVIHVHSESQGLSIHGWVLLSHAVWCMYVHSLGRGCGHVQSVLLLSQLGNAGLGVGVILQHALKVSLADGEDVYVCHRDDRRPHGAVADETLDSEVASLTEHLRHQHQTPTVIIQHLSLQHTTLVNCRVHHLTLGIL